MEYRLKHFCTPNVLNISWTGPTPDESGDTGRDCLVIASSDTLPKLEVEHAWPYSIPMTLVNARDFIENNKKMLGTMVRNCVGLKLENEQDSTVLFEKPILIDS